MASIGQIIAGAALAALIWIGPAHAQQPPFATTKVEGTDNIYVFRYGNAQAMFVVTKEGVIATDPIGYGRPQAVATYIEEIKKSPINPSGTSSTAITTSTTLPAANRSKTPAPRLSPIRKPRRDSNG